MSTDPQAAPRPLPDRPNLRRLKDQAKDLVKAGTAKSITDAQFKIARLYGFPSWPKLKAHVDSLEEIGQLKQAIDGNDFGRVKNLMTRNPELHHAPLGYAKNGPLTWVAECRVPWEPPSRARLAMAKWMIENGSDVHQGGDGPLMRAALKGNRIPMMELLVSYGKDLNAEWNGDFPIIFAPCEAVDPEALLIMRTIALQAMHGWAIAQRIQQISDDLLRVQQGSLYPALHRLEHQGWITAEWGASENNRRARFYSLTRAGRKQLATEVSKWERLSAGVHLVLQRT